MKIEFSSTIPVPESTRSPTGQSKYPFGKLENLGDSFHMSNGKPARNLMWTAQTAYYNFNKKRKNAGEKPIKLVFRVEGDGVRVWRTA